MSDGGTGVEFVRGSDNFGGAMAVVVPSNRPVELKKMMEAWIDQAGREQITWHLVVDDAKRFEGFLVLDDPNVVIHSNQDIDNELGDDAWIIPHDSAARRSFGIYKAWQAGAKTIVMLDDDVYPFPGDKSHLWKLSLRLQTKIDTGSWAWIGPQKQRGVPYELPEAAPVLFMGGWYGHPDLDAPTRLTQPIDEAYKKAQRHLGVNLVHPGQWLAFSAMHVAFKAELAPAMYQLLQGPGWGYRRFDDIWSGMFMKHICDTLGWPVAWGDPMVNHRQASNVFANLEQEAPGIREHEMAWKAIAGMWSPEAARDEWDTVQEMYAGLGKVLADTLGRGPDRHPEYPGLDHNYWAKLGEAMQVWAGLFDNGRVEFKTNQAETSRVVPEYGPVGVPV